MRVERLLTPALALAVAAVALVWNQQPDSNHTVAILFPGSVEYFDVQSEAMSDAAELYGLDIQEFDAGWQPGEQIRHLEIAADNNFDAIAIAPVDRDAEEAAASIARETGIPVITFTNTFMFGREKPVSMALDGVTTFIGRDEFTSGRLLGEQVQALEREHLRILTIEGPIGAAPSELRAAGFAEIAAREPGWVIVDRLSAEGWGLDALASEFGGVSAGLGIDVVVCQWADAAVWVVGQLDELGMSDVKVVSLEWTRELAIYVETGTVESSTYSSIRDEGEIVIVTLINLLSHQSVDDFVEIDQWVVTQEGAGDVVAEW